jgi:hypothetical protein
VGELLQGRLDFVVEGKTEVVARSTEEAIVPTMQNVLVQEQSTVPESSQPPKLNSLRDFLQRLEQLNTCYNGACDYPRTDPRSYEFAVGQELRRSIFQMAEWVRGEALELSEISQAAREFMGSDDGHVQAAALDLLSTQPISNENLQAILQKILQGYDAQLIEHALLELRRYSAPNDRQQIDQALADALLTGAPFVAREVASHIASFISDRNTVFFRQIAVQLPDQSFYRIQLEAALVP